MRALSNLSNQLQNSQARLNAAIEFNPNELSDTELAKLKEASNLIDQAATVAKQAADLVGHTPV